MKRGKDKNQIEGLREKLVAAVRRKAQGYETTESVEEYARIDGQLTLVKRRVTVKEVPADVAAVRFMLEECAAETDYMSEQQLKEEKLRLIKLLKEDEIAAD